MNRYLLSLALAASLAWGGFIAPAASAQDNSGTSRFIIEIRDGKTFVNDQEVVPDEDGRIVIERKDENGETRSYVISRKGGNGQPMMFFSGDADVEYEVHADGENGETVWWSKDGDDDGVVARGMVRRNMDAQRERMEFQRQRMEGQSERMEGQRGEMEERMREMELRGSMSGDHPNERRDMENVFRFSPAPGAPYEVLRNRLAGGDTWGAQGPAANAFFFASGAEGAESRHDLMEKEQEIRHLAAELRGAEEADRGELEARLDQKLNEAFDLKESIQREEIQRIEARLRELQERSEVRADSRSEIIARRKKELLGRRDPLDW